MKKGFNKTAITGVLAGIVLVGGAGAVALANGNAYGAFKSAAFKTMEAENMTSTYEYTITQDGQGIITGSGYSQQDGENHYSSMNMQVNGEAIEFESSFMDGKSITRLGEEYSSYDFDDDGDDDDDDDRYDWHGSNGEQLAEAATDLFVGDLKNHFTSDGDNISLSLEGAQVPEIINIALSAIVEERPTERHKMPEGMDTLTQVLENLPIQKDAVISSISMDANVKDGYLGQGTVTIAIAGKDSAGADHKAEIKCTFSISDIGSTSPATIDTTGKTVTEKNWGLGY